MEYQSVNFLKLCKEITYQNQRCKIYLEQKEGDNGELNNNNMILTNFLTFDTEKNQGQNTVKSPAFPLIGIPETVEQLDYTYECSNDQSVSSEHTRHLETFTGSLRQFNYLNKFGHSHFDFQSVIDAKKLPVPDYISFNYLNQAQEKTIDNI